MLAKNRKLSVEDFPRNSKTIFKGHYVTFKIFPGEGKASVLVIKARAKKAFLRNKIKRLIYNFLKDQEPPKEVNLLVVLNSSIMKLDSETKNLILKELEEGFAKIN